MKIGINARYLQKPQTGIESYLLNLILNLKKIDNENEYVLFFGNDEPIPKIILDKKFNYHISKIPTNSQILRIIWEHLYLPLVIKKEKIDVFHEPSFIAPLIKKCPTVITIYDLAYLHFPHCYTYRNRIYLKALLSRSIKNADMVIAISKNTKKDIIDYFSISSDKVQVIYGGVDGFFHITNDKQKLEQVRKKYNITKNFILNVSLITPRKNLITLINAFKGLRKDRNIDCQLVITGGKGWLYEDVFKTVSALGLEDEVIFTGYVPDEDLLYLYNAATLFAYPSLYEGFGLPILEAMACGCPVGASNTSSIPEVCGDAALLISPCDIEELSHAIYKLITDNSLRQMLIKKGLEQVKKFSWKKTAEETLAVYKRVRNETYKV
jgi:glycosyltransferase involved in cell wall biosynthesis